MIPALAADEAVTGLAALELDQKRLPSAARQLGEIENDIGLSFERRGNSLGHVTGQCKPVNQEHRAESIYDVVHIESVAWTLPISVSRQGSIQTVAKPVEQYAEIHQVQQQRIVFACRVARTGHKHGDKPEDR